jgi:RNA polymerase-binding transcription factor DksA
MNDDSRATDARARLRHDLELRRRTVVDELQRCLSRIRQAEMRAPDTETCEDDTRDIDAGLVDILNATVRRIDAALERLARGGYGLCTGCNRAIAEARLRAMPFAVRCQTCESTRERDATMRRARARPEPWAEGHAVAHNDR